VQQGARLVHARGGEREVAVAGERFLDQPIERGIGIEPPPAIAACRHA
jgi:hypothetical protein